MVCLTGNHLVTCYFTTVLARISCVIQDTKVVIQRLQDAVLTWSFSNALILLHVEGSLELLRQMLTQKALPDRKRQMLISVADVDFLAAATNPGCLGSFSLFPINYCLVNHLCMHCFIRQLALLAF